MKKRWGILLGITGMAMAALLTGCKGTGEAKAPGEAGGETSVETSAAGLSGDKTGDAAAGAAGEGQITFTFAEHVANIEQQAPQVYGVVQEYMKLHPNVTIELTGASADDLTETSRWLPRATRCRTCSGSASPWLWRWQKPDIWQTCPRIF